jgi:hypothetical protein
VLNKIDVTGVDYDVYVEGEAAPLKRLVQETFCDTRERWTAAGSWSRGLRVPGLEAGDKGAEGQVHDVSDRQDDTFHYSNGEEAAAHPTASPTGTRTAIVPGTVAEIPCFPRSGSMRVIQVPASAAAKSKALQGDIDA